MHPHFNTTVNKARVAGLVAVALSIGMLLSADLAFAQSGLEAGKDITGQKPDASSDDGSPSAPDLSKNPVDTSPDSPTVYTDPYKPESGPLVLINCSGKSISAKTYNSNDTVLWVPFQTKSIGNGKSAGLKCATGSCKLAIGSVKTAALSGYRVYVGGAVKPTNRITMAMGCKPYR